MRNKWIKAALDDVRSGRFRVLSLDIFDTTVWRTFPRPEDVFLALGAEARRRGWVPPGMSPATFAMLRTGSEEAARKRRRCGMEVTLEEIYDEFPSQLFPACSSRRLMELELEIERRATRPFPEVVELISEARSLGLRIAFVSDTYFHEDHLRTILPVAPDYLIRSCAYGVSKQGSLHLALIRASGVAPGEILHLGDNYVADVEAPARLGIETRWLPKFEDDWKDALQSELPEPRSERAEYFPSAAGDFGLCSLRSQVAGTLEAAGDPYRAWGGVVLGPVMAGFGEWVLERCRERQISSVLCLMREGRAVRRALMQLDATIPVSEFFVSRYAALRCSVFSGTAGEIEEFLLRPSVRCAGQLSEPLGIAAESMGLASGEAIRPEQVHELAARIAGDAGLRRKAVEASRRQRRNLLKYLRKRLGEIPNRIALVDLGYAGTIQRHLQRIFDEEGIPCQTHGLYLVTNRRIRRLLEAGGRAEGYLADYDQPLAISHSFSRSPEIFEQCLMSDCGSTAGYDDAGEPVTEPSSIPREQMEQILRVQQGVSDFLDLWTAAHGDSRPSALELLPFLRAAVVRALTAPSPLELSLFGDWIHDENLGAAAVRKLTDCGLPETYLPYLSAHQLASLPSSSIYWVFGLACKIHPALGAAVRAIFLRRTPAEVFVAPEAPLVLKVSWMNGTREQTGLPVQPNTAGKAWIRLTVAADQAGGGILEIASPAGLAVEGVYLCGAGGARLSLVFRSDTQQLERWQIRGLAPGQKTVGVDLLISKTYTRLENAAVATLSL